MKILNLWSASRLIPLLTLLAAFAIPAFAENDCRKIKAFKKTGKQTVHVEVDRVFWKEKEKVYGEESVCKGDVKFMTYDVRGREGEAFDCLAPAEGDIFNCKTKWNGEDAEIHVVPASWIRSWKPKAVREYRFHAYITKTGKPEFMNDLFARGLHFDLKRHPSMLEASQKSGSLNRSDAFFVRTDFK